MTSQLSAAQISEFVCTRISHDLIGNIGAVANALELFDENDPDCLNDVKPILEISAKTLSARLKFFRLAFGLSNTSVDNINELTNIAQSYIQTIGSRTSPIDLTFSLHTPQLYKIAFLGIMALGDVFIRGGRLIVKEADTGLTISASSASPLSAGKLSTMQNVLNGTVPQENPAQPAPLFYLKSLLENSAVKISLNFTDSEAVLQIA